MRAAVKVCKAGVMERAMFRFEQIGGTAFFASVLGADVTLAPAPRSSPQLPGAGALWPGKLIAEALVRAGAAAATMCCLRRTVAVPKAAFATPGARPSVEKHMSTMAVERGLESPPRITVVDDFVTKGRMLLAATSLIADAFPEAEVAAFALVRTRGLVDEIERIVDPVVGVITFEDGDARRSHD
jgi:hypothetical protein